MIPRHSSNVIIPPLILALTQIIWAGATQPYRPPHNLSARHSHYLLVLITIIKSISTALIAILLSYYLSLYHSHTVFIPNINHYQYLFYHAKIDTIIKYHISHYIYYHFLYLFYFSLLVLVFITIITFYIKVKAI